MRRLPPFLLLLAASACSHASTLPPAAALHNDEGVRALREGDLETADHQLNLALEYAPDFVEALVNLGLVELERGNFERARVLLQRARRRQPDVAEPHHGLGVLAEREGDLEEAEVCYREALRVDPGFLPARMALARLYYDAGLLEAARVEFGRATAAAPEDAEVAAGLAQALMSLGRDEDAGRVIRGAQSAGGAPALTLASARLLLKSGELGEARRRLEQLSVEQPELRAARLAWLAVIELAERQPVKAEQLATEALGIYPAESVARWVLRHRERESDGVK